MPFTVQEVTAAIKRLKNKKSARIDGILNKFLKHCPNAMYNANMLLPNYLILLLTRVLSQQTGV